MTSWIGVIQQIESGTIPKSGTSPARRLRLREMTVQGLEDDPYHSVTLTFTPIEAPSPVEELAALARRIIEADAMGDDEVTRQGLRALKDSCPPNCNLIPSPTRAACFPMLVLVPELLSVYARNEPESPLWREYSNDPPCSSLGLLAENDSCGICCTLCLATRQVQRCFLESLGKNNRVIYVVGDDSRIRSARCPELRCSGWEGDAIQILNPMSPSSPPSIAEPVGQRRARPVSCWREFVRKVGGISIAGRRPRVFLNGKSV